LVINRRLALAVVSLTAVAVTIPSTTSLAASHVRGTTVKPAVPGSRYLALGDSVAFGYRESANLPTPDYTKPGTFLGYPEELAANLGLKLTNAACPGETTSSFLNMTAASNGCENHYDTTSKTEVAGGYRALYPLHASYTGSQWAFAKQFLRSHPGTRLVTIMMGANDGFLCLESTSDSCVGEFGQLLSTLRKNIATTLKGIRGTGYAGQIVLNTYYSTNYSDSILTGEIMALNQALTQASAPYHVKIANQFDAFQTATAQNSGDTCAAALVTVLTTGGCGVHPSVAGAALLAQTAERQVVTH
jgi:lysophospholipase L1-like esterase